jgi:hypothetical protein
MKRQTEKQLREAIRCAIDGHGTDPRPGLRDALAYRRALKRIANCELACYSNGTGPLALALLEEAKSIAFRALGETTTMSENEKII